MVANPNVEVLDAEGTPEVSEQDSGGSSAEEAEDLVKLETNEEQEEEEAGQWSEELELLL